MNSTHKKAKKGELALNNLNKKAKRDKKATKRPKGRNETPAAAPPPGWVCLCVLVRAGLRGSVLACAGFCWSLLRLGPAWVN